MTEKKPEEEKPKATKPEEKKPEETKGNRSSDYSWCPFWLNDSDRWN